MLLASLLTYLSYIWIIIKVWLPLTAPMGRLWQGVVGSGREGEVEALKRLHLIYNTHTNRLQCLWENPCAPTIIGNDVLLRRIVASIVKRAPSAVKKVQDDVRRGISAAVLDSLLGLLVIFKDMAAYFEVAKVHSEPSRRQAVHLAARQMDALFTECKHCLDTSIIGMKAQIARAQEIIGCQPVQKASESRSTDEQRWLVNIPHGMTLEDYMGLCEKSILFARETLGRREDFQDELAYLSTLRTPPPVRSTLPLHTSLGANADAVKSCLITKSNESRQRSSNRSITVSFGKGEEEQGPYSRRTNRRRTKAYTFHDLMPEDQKRISQA